MSNIRFGTDGWRGIIAEDFTYKNVRRVAQAIADYLGNGAVVVVGYDTRFMSRDFAHLISGVLSGNGIKVIISDSPTPTPMLSYFVKYGNLNGGIMVTASHNPAIYNGVKFKEPYGCSSLPETTRKIEALIDKSPPRIKGGFDTKDISRPYLKALRRYILPVKKRFFIVVDSMYGAGGYYLEQILKELGHKVVTIHGEPNPIFPGINPEPIEINLTELSKTVRDLGADIGIATDGDADRVGIVDENGRFLTPHYVLSLLLVHLKTSRGWHGAVAKTISSTSLIDKIAERYNMPVKETPVGFKHIANLMLTEDILIGGEESGGNGFKNHIPERDGLLSGLLIVEIMGTKGKSISQIVRDMEMEFGRYRYRRVDLHTTQKELKKIPDEIAGKKVVQKKTFDGTKFILEDGSWLLIRASGTEPILRLYAEASTQREVEDLIEEGRRLI